MEDFFAQKRSLFHQEDHLIPRVFLFKRNATHVCKVTKLKNTKNRTTDEGKPIINNGCVQFLQVDWCAKVGSCFVVFFFIKASRDFKTAVALQHKGKKKHSNLMCLFCKWYFLRQTWPDGVCDMSLGIQKQPFKRSPHFNYHFIISLIISM